MEHEALAEDDWAVLSELIARQMGLHFPPERREDLQRGILSLSREMGADETATVRRLLLTAPATSELHRLANHLTVGETYFFRDPAIFEALREQVLPPLIHARRQTGQRLFFWSAGCCTGEEPYTLAMLLHQMLPDLADWQIVILATDLNPQYLRKGAAGIYGKWSFRETSAWQRDRFFRPCGDGNYEILPAVRNLVRFARLNLADAAAMNRLLVPKATDLIFCRNVLMYFTTPQMQKVVQRLYNALLPDGWLIVSPSETSQATYHQFTSVNFPGAILYQKAPARKPQATPAPVEPAKRPAWSATETPAKPSSRSVVQTEKPRAASRPSPPEEVPVAPRDTALIAELSARTRSLADEGRLPEARAACEQWVAKDKLNISAHYLHAVLLKELGDYDGARASLQRTIFLQPDFVSGHFALGNVARLLQKPGEAEKHFANALNLLRRLPPATRLPETDGLTAGQLSEMLGKLLTKGPQP